MPDASPRATQENYLIGHSVLPRRWTGHGERMTPCGAARRPRRTDDACGAPRRQCRRLAPVAGREKRLPPQWRVSGRRVTPLPALGPDLAQELARVVHAAVLPDLEVHVGPGGATGRTGLGDLLADADQVADLHRIARVVRVTGHVAIAVVDLDHVAVAAAHAGKTDHAVGHGHHRVAGAGVEV